LTPLPRKFPFKGKNFVEVDKYELIRQECISFVEQFIDRLIADLYKETFSIPQIGG
jgi:hypothetical protein